MFDDIPENYKSADRRQRGRRLALHAGRQERAPAARAADPRPRRPLHHARGQGGPRQPARRRLPRHRLDQGSASRTRAEHIKKKLPSMYHQFKELARHRHHEGADGGRPDDALHHGRRPRGRRHADVDACPGCSPRASAPPASTAPIASAATRCPTCSSSASAPASTRRSSRRSRRGARDRRAAGRRGRAAGARAVRARHGGRGPVPGAARAAGHDAGPGRHRPQRRRDAAGARRRSSSCASARGDVGVGGNREYNPGWHTALDLHNLLTVSEAITRCGARAQGEPRRPLPRRLSRTRIRVRRSSTSSCARAPDGGMELSRVPIPPMPRRAEADHRGE